MIESYNKENARRYGTAAAVILEKLIYFTASNIVNKQNLIEGRTYVNIKGGIKGFAEILNEYSPSQIRYNLDKLEKADAIQKTSEHNRNKYDKTNLYLVNSIFENQILKKVQDIQGKRQKPEPIAPRAAPATEQRPHKPEPITPRPERPEPATTTDKGAGVVKIFNLYYKDIYKTPPPPLNKHTAAAAEKIYKAILKDIQQITGTTEHAKKRIINQIEWFFYAAATLYKNEILKFNLIYMEAASEKITTTLHTLSKQHYNKDHKFKRRFFINIGELI